MFLTNLSNTDRGRKRLLNIAIDWVIAFASLWLAYSLRLGEAFTAWSEVIAPFAIVPIGTVVLFAGLGVYRWMVRSSNSALMVQIAKGTVLSSLLLAMVMFLLPAPEVNPRSLFAIYGMLLLINSIAARALWQVLQSERNLGEPIAIFGAGSAGRQLAQSLIIDTRFRPVVFIDDDPNLARTLVSGLPVLHGALEDLPRRLRERDVGRIVIAIPSLSASAYARKLDELERLDLPLSTIPTIAEIADGSIGPDAIRQIQVADILGRRENLPDTALIEACVSGKSVMVTGGGGSIGSELCRQILDYRPACLVVVDSSEANLYHVTEEIDAVLAARAADDAPIRFEPVLCSVTNRARIDRIVKTYAVDTIYHAAAYKHVPIVESFPEQGLDVNVFGTQAVLDAAIAHDVERFVLVSTDKAVRPKSTMGATKRIAELVLQAYARREMRTRVCMVRFGNVLGSSGSVVPKFQRQIETGQPITITDPNMTRYFMTIPEAAQLVLQASAISRGGDVFVLDMGEPVRIIDVARRMARLYGKHLRIDTHDEHDIEVVVQGVRPGEKLREELFLSEALVESTRIPKVSTADEAWIPWPLLSRKLEELRKAADGDDLQGLRERLLALAFLEDVEAAGGDVRLRARAEADTANDDALTVSSRVDPAHA